MKTILYIGNKLGKHGFSPTSIDILPGLLEKEGFKIISASSVRNKTLRLIDMLSSIIRYSKKADLVLIDTYSTKNFWYAVLTARLCKKLNKDYIFYMHGGNLPERLEKSSAKVLELFRCAEACIAPSAYLKDQLKDFELRNLICIPNFIELENYSFLARKKIQPKLLWVRAFDKSYNPQLAVTALEKLLKKYPDSELCMVGPEKDGTLESLKKYVISHDLPVSFTGKLSKTEWIALSKDYDIFLNTTTIDNTPVSLIEAMALGLPIITTNVGGIPYIIKDRENGLLLKNQSAEEICQKIIYLIEEPEKAGEISLNARKKVENFSWQLIKPMWIQFLS